MVWGLNSAVQFVYFLYLMTTWCCWSVAAAATYMHCFHCTWCSVSTTDNTCVCMCVCVCGQRPPRQAAEYKLSASGGPMFVAGNPSNPFILLLPWLLPSPVYIITVTDSDNWVWFGVSFYWACHCCRPLSINQLRTVWYRNLQTFCWRCLSNWGRTWLSRVTTCV